MNQERWWQVGLLVVVLCVLGGAVIWARSVPEPADSSAPRSPSGESRMAQPGDADRSPVQGRQARATPEAAPAPKRSERPTMQDFTLPNLEGASVTFSEFRDGRPFVVAFGQTTCPPCVLQLHVFKQMREKYGDQVAILEVNIGEPAERVAAFAARHESPFTTLIDADASVYLRFGSYTVPLTVVGDAAGRILQVGGYMPSQQLSRLFDAALAEAEATGDTKPEA